jgi:hypothetical protein
MTCPPISAPAGDGGAEGDRTPDLRIANATLSQLSYGPDAAQSYGQREELSSGQEAGTKRARGVHGAAPCAARGGTLGSATAAPDAREP